MVHRKNRIFLTLLLVLLTACQLSGDSRNSEYNKARDTLLKTHYLLFQNYADEIDADELTKAAIEGMTDALDPYTVLLERQEKFQMDLITKGEYGGVGIRIGLRNDSLTVITPMEDTPAWRAGFLPGDRIVAIDSVRTSTLKLDEASDHIRGVPGTPVSLTIVREQKTGEVTLTVIREVIEVQEIPFAGFIRPGIAYIKLNGFSKKAGEQLTAQLDSLQQIGLQGMILDLRNNGGGLLDQALEILSLYLPADLIAVETKGYNRRYQRNFTLQNSPLLDSKVRIAILINQGSASASEIVAGVTQDLDRGIVLGRRSFGKGLVQNVFPLDDSTAVKITTSKYFIPSGRLIQKEDYFHNKSIIRTHEDGTCEYVTKNGRKMEAGGGIEPDSVISEEDPGDLISDLWRKQKFVDFAREYLLAHPEYSGREKTEQIYFPAFLQWLKDGEYHFEDPLLKQINGLETEFRDAEKLSRQAETAFKSLRQSLMTASLDSMVAAEKDLLLLLLGSELAAFHGGQHGRIEARLNYDKTLKTAVQLIQDDQYMKNQGMIPCDTDTEEIH